MIEFDLSRLPDADIVKIGAWITARGATNWPFFCTWIAGALGQEAERRGNGDGDIIVRLALPNHWSDAALADCMSGALTLSYAREVDAITGQLLDAVCNGFVSLGANRLRAHDRLANDPQRN